MCIAKTPATLKDIHNAQDRPQTCNTVCMKGSYLYLVPQHSTACLTCPTSIFHAGQLSLKIRHMSIYIAKTPATLKDSHNAQDRPQTCNVVCMKGSYLYLVPQHSTTCLPWRINDCLANQFWPVTCFSRPFCFWNPGLVYKTTTYLKIAMTHVRWLSLDVCRLLSQQDARQCTW